MFLDSNEIYMFFFARKEWLTKIYCRTIPTNQESYENNNTDFVNVYDTKSYVHVKWILIKSHLPQNQPPVYRRMTSYLYLIQFPLYCHRLPSWIFCIPPKCTPVRSITHTNVIHDSQMLLLSHLFLSRPFLWKLFWKRSLIFNLRTFLYNE